MNTNDLNTALYEKMAAEQDKYRDWLKSQPPAEVLNHAYEYTVRGGHRDGDGGTGADRYPGPGPAGFAHAAGPMCTVTLRNWRPATRM